MDGSPHLEGTKDKVSLRIQSGGKGNDRTPFLDTETELAGPAVPKASGLAPKLGQSEVAQWARGLTVQPAPSSVLLGRISLSSHTQHSLFLFSFSPA